MGSFLARLLRPGEFPALKGTIGLLVRVAIVGGVGLLLYRVGYLRGYDDGDRHGADRVRRVESLNRQGMRNMLRNAGKQTP